jgi:hypothetical protein
MGNSSPDLLAGFSIVTSMILIAYLAGTLVVLMLSGGRSLEAAEPGNELDASIAILFGMIPQAE